MDEKKNPIAAGQTVKPSAPSAAEKRLTILAAKANALRESYPNFELREEMKEPIFVKLLQAGVDMRAAYEFVHRDELLGALVSEVAQGVRSRVLRDVQTRGARPAENGTGGRAPATIREALPSEWSKEERERIGREVLNGRKHNINL